MAGNEGVDLIRAARRRSAAVPSLILDSGAVIALARGDQRLRARLRAASQDRADVVVPPIVVTQTLRGGPRNAPINQLLETVQVPPADLTLARLAGHLLGISNHDDAADAQIAAEAIRHAPCVVLTSDPDDMSILLADREGVHISSI